jgi:hypothetical protein
VEEWRVGASRGSLVGGSDESLEPSLESWGRECGLRLAQVLDEIKHHEHSGRHQDWGFTFLSNPARGSLPNA